MNPLTNHPNSAQGNNGTGTIPPATHAGLPQETKPLHFASPPPANNESRATGAYKETDAIPRNRDASGNRLPWLYAGSPTWVDDVEVYKTDMGRIIEAVEKHNTIAAKNLGHFYNHRLLPALRRVISRHEEGERRAAVLRALAEPHNTQLDEQEAQINQDDRDTLAQTEEALPPAHQEAAHKVARAGGEYDPASPSGEAALRVREQSRESIAGELRLPWTQSEQPNKSRLITRLCSILVGLFIGVSIALISQIAVSGNWFARPIPFATCLGAGLAAAFFGKQAIRKSSRAVGERYWLGLPISNWGPLAVLSAVVTVGIVAMDAYVEREGLMAGVRLRETLAGAVGSAPQNGQASEALYLLMAMILTFGYAVSGWWEGYLEGRGAACVNRIQHAQESRLAESETARRSDSTVQEAVEAVAKVKCLLHQHQLLSARIAERKATMDAQRLPVTDNLSPEDALLVQQAVDEMNVAQAEFDALLAEIKIRYGVGGADSRSAGGFWNNLLLNVEGKLARTRNKRKRPERKDAPAQ